jgi:probable FeS assembly SUF system protein SufT
MNEFLPLQRAVEATQIPSGHAVTLPEGTIVSITQALGGVYTVHASTGGLYRIGSQDADALGMEPVAQPQVAEGPFSEELVWAALREVYDPEIPVNIVDLGLIYDMKAEAVPGQDGSLKVTVQMTLTAPGCGMGPALAADARQRISVLPGVAEADVLLVWDPPWGPERISPEGRTKLGID